MSPRKILTKLTFILLVSTIFAAGVSAQNNDSLQTKATYEPMRQGTYSLEFQLGDALSKRNSGVSISVKRQKSEKSAIRLGVNIATNISSESSDNTYVNYPDSSYTTDHSQFDFDNQSISFMAQYLRYVPVKHPIFMYWGLGPRIGFWRHSETDKRNNNGNEAPGPTTERKFYSLSGSVEGVLGAEWFASKRISINAEYGASIRYSYAWSRDIVIGLPDFPLDEYKTTNKSLNFNLLDVLFGISVYF